VSQNIDEVLDVAKKAQFDGIIDDAITSFRNQSSFNPRFANSNISKLEELKKAEKLTNSDLELFIKLSDNKIKAQHFPHIGEWLKNDVRKDPLKKALSE
jgi:tyrosine-protein phosphatase YwqE